MKTEVLKESGEAKGFVISFAAPGPVKPKPQLKARRSSAARGQEQEMFRGQEPARRQEEQEIGRGQELSRRQEEEEERLVVRQGTVEGEEELSIEVTRSVEDDTLRDTVTPDSEEFSFSTQPELCVLCCSRSPNTRLSGQGVCSSCLALLRSLLQEQPSAPCVTGQGSCSLATSDNSCPGCFLARSSSLGLTLDSAPPGSRRTWDPPGKEQLEQAEQELAERKVGGWSDRLWWLAGVVVFIIFLLLCQAVQYTFQWVLSIPMTGAIP